MNKDLTTGNANKVLIFFTLPLFISVMFQQFYNIADSVIAGKYAGEEALAAVGASYPITNTRNTGCPLSDLSMHLSRRLHMETGMGTNFPAIK